MIFEKAKAVYERFIELENRLSSSEVYRSPDFKELAREHTGLKKIREPWLRYLKLAERAAEAERILLSDEDRELKELAELDKSEAADAIEALREEFIDILIADDEESKGSLIMELRSGTGGDEASLFAADLFRMYQRFCERQKWRFNILEQSMTEIGGFREAIVQITGDGAFRRLQSEGGGHRVQRVPTTETGGRIHTSAATVAVLPEAEEVDVELDPAELRIEVQRASGAGGQHVNKTESAVRITHEPTGIVVYAQSERSQHKNRATAMRVLRSRVYDVYRQQADARRSSDRNVQIGSGDRSQRIRTYNFPQNRVTDHRLGENFSLEKIIVGDLDDLLDRLEEYRKIERLKNLEV